MPFRREAHPGQRDAARHRVVGKVARREIEVKARDEVRRPCERAARAQGVWAASNPARITPMAIAVRMITTRRSRAITPSILSSQVRYHSAVEDQLMRMKSWLKVVMSAAFSLVASTVMGQTPAAELKVGDMAPAFSAPGSDGKTHTLAESKGKQAVVLAWFPKAFTGG